MTPRKVAIELAGMVNDRGGIGQAIETQSILRPDYARLALNKDRTELVYSTRPPLLGDKQKDDLLDRFIRLERATAEEILDFAKSYGVLSLRALREEGEYAEDLDQWRDFARRARATIDLGASVHTGDATRQEDWGHVRPWWFENWHRLVGKRQAERNQMADVLNAWLELAEVRPCFVWRENESRIVFTNVDHAIPGQLTMLGALALQIVLAVNRARLIAKCSGCGHTYSRKRQAPRGRANYCDDCGRRAAWRDAQARRRAAIDRKTRRRK